MFVKKCQTILYFGFVVDEFSELVDTTKSFVIRLPVTVSNRLNAPQSEIFTEFPQKTSCKPNKSIRCLLRNVNRLQKVMLFCLRDNCDVTESHTSYMFCNLAGKIQLPPIKEVTKKKRGFSREGKLGF